MEISEIELNEELSFWINFFLCNWIKGLKVSEARIILKDVSDMKTDQPEFSDKIPTVFRQFKQTGRFLLTTVGRIGHLKMFI